MGATAPDGGDSASLAVVPIFMFIGAVALGMKISIYYFTAVAFSIPAVWLLDLAFRKRW